MITLLNLLSWALSSTKKKKHFHISWLLLKNTPDILLFSSLSNFVRRKITFSIPIKWKYVWNAKKQSLKILISNLLVNSSSSLNSKMIIVPLKLFKLGLSPSPNPWRRKKKKELLSIEQKFLTCVPYWRPRKIKKIISLFILVWFSF